MTISYGTHFGKHIHWHIYHCIKFRTQFVLKIIDDIRLVSMLRCHVLRVAQNLDLLCHKFDYFQNCGAGYRLNRSKLFFTNLSLLSEPSCKNPLHSSYLETTADSMENSSWYRNFPPRFSKGPSKCGEPSTGRDLWHIQKIKHRAQWFTIAKTSRLRVLSILIVSSMRAFWSTII